MSSNLAILPVGAILGGRSMLIDPNDGFKYGCGKVARKELRQLRRLLTAAAAGDVEAIHDVRAGLRRIRAVLEVHGGEKAKHHRRHAGKFASALGPIRDLDVSIERLANAIESGLAPTSANTWFAELEVERSANLQAARSVVESKEFEVWRKDFAGWCEEQDGGYPLRRRLAQAMRRHLDVAEQYASSPSTEDLHRLRIEIKKIRYLLELFPTTFSEKGARAAKQLERLQDAFGRHRDDLRLAALAKLQPGMQDFAVRLEKLAPSEADLRREAHDVLRSVGLLASPLARRRDRS